MTTSAPLTRSIALALALAASGLVLSGCAAPVGSPASAASGGSSAAARGAPTATGDAACSVISMSELKALVNAPIGKPYNALGSDPSNFACEYGIGKNAGLTGSAIVTAEDDTILITKYGQLGKTEYQTSISDLPASSVIAYPGLGDKASYWNEFGRGPHLYSYKGNVGCEVSVNPDNMTEVGAGAGGATQEMSDADAAIVVKREAPICMTILGG
jgi:hypothetical protein